MSLSTALSPSVSPALAARCAAGGGRPKTRALNLVRRALTSKEPSETPSKPDKERTSMSDPLSAMMNFISDVNPLASVFKSPDGASPDASPARDTRKSLERSRH